MNKHRRISIVEIPILGLLLFCQIAGATQFDTNVPDREPLPLRPIRDVELYLDFPKNTGHVTVDITRNKDNSTKSLTIDSNLAVGSLGSSVSDGDYPADEQPSKLDTASVEVANGNNLSNRLKVRLELESNWSATCNNTQAAAETWTINTDKTITGACINSYEVNGLACDSLLIQPNNTPATITLPNIPTITPCAEIRPAIDVMLVLDQSGSMNSNQKIDRLNTAVNNFVGVWNQTGIATTGDTLGTVLFNQNATDWSVDSGLQTFDSALASAITAASITAGGSTSIGNGLELAANHLFSGSNSRKVILLMSDGMQNTDRRVAVVPDDGSVGGLAADLDGDGSTSDMVAVTYNLNGTGYAALPDLANLNIWSVSIGSAATDIDPTIFEDLADTGTGFYINSEVDPTELNLFFLELLQNFLRFNTIETTRLVNDTIPITHLATGDIGTTQLKVATTSTAKTVSFTVMWDKTKEARFGLQIAPPAGPAISSNDESSHIQRGPGFMRFTTALPLPEPYPSGSQIGDWKVTITAQGSGLGDKFPYQFYALADDDSVKAKFNIDKGDYYTGKPIPLQAKLTEFGHALVDNNGKLNVFAKLIKPQDGIGNLLADNDASTTPTASDPKSPAQQKLDALLEKNPNLLKYSSETVQLFDDGQASHNDAVANDGIFNNLYTNTNKQGQYNFLFGVEGKTNHSGPMSRQQIETVYVRLQPDPGNTLLTSQFIGTGPDRQLKVTMIPRDRFGNRFGPGYANQFLISPIYNMRPKFQDKNQNGVYEFTVPANADASLPKLDVQYVKPFIHVSDEMYPDKIPQSLTQSYIDDGLRGKKHSVSIHAGVNYPHGSLDNTFDGSTSYALDYEYHWDKLNSLLLFLGKNKFDHPSIDLDITNFSINAKHYFTAPAVQSISYFVNGGLGYYSLDPGDDDLGLNAGGGAQYRINSDFGVEGWYNYHYVTTTPEIKFSTLQLGVFYLF